VLRLLLIAGVVAALVSAPSAGAVPTLLMPGVTYEKQVQFTSHGPVVIHVLIAPRPGGLWSLRPVLSNESILGTEKVTEIEERLVPSETTVGVNGDLFGADGHPQGILMRNGLLEHTPLEGRSSIGIDAQGTLHVDRVSLIATWQGKGQRRAVSTVNEPVRPNSVSIFTSAWGPATPSYPGTVEVVLDPFPGVKPNTPTQGPVTQVSQNGNTPIPADGAVLVGRGTAAAKLAAEAPVGQNVVLRPVLRPAWTGVVDALGGGPLIVKAGIPVFRAGETFTTDQLLPRTARTGVGQLADGRIVLVTADGGFPGYSNGLTNFELAQTIARLGAVTACALGSSTSTTMAFDGQLLNRPSAPGGDQPVAEALLAAYTGVYAPPAPTQVLSPNGDGVAEQQTLSYKIVRPSTVNANLLGPDGVPRWTFSGPQAPGVYSVAWTGLRADGTSDAEGVYHWVVDANDNQGLHSAVDRRFAINNTLGFAKPVTPPLDVPRIEPRAVATFQLTRPATVLAKIETQAGAVLRTIGKSHAEAGMVAVAWDGRTDDGASVYSGRYVARLTATNELGSVSLTTLFDARRLPGRR
jgi:hypothetical protein